MVGARSISKANVFHFQSDNLAEKVAPPIPLLQDLGDLSDGCCLAAVVSYYCPMALHWQGNCKFIYYIPFTKSGVNFVHYAFRYLLKRSNKYGRFFVQPSTSPKVLSRSSSLRH